MDKKFINFKFLRRDYHQRSEVNFCILERGGGENVRKSRLWHAVLPRGRCSPVPASQSFPAQPFSIRATLPESIHHPKQTPGTPGGSMPTVGSHLMSTIPWYVGITNDQNLGFPMHKSSSALYLSKPPRLGFMGWEVQASSTTASYCMPSSYLVTLKMKPTLPSQIWKTHCFEKCLTLNKYFKDIKFTKISVNIQQTKI